MDFNKCFEELINLIKSFTNPEELSLTDINKLIEGIKSFKKCKKATIVSNQLTLCFNHLLGTLYKYSSVRIENEAYIPITRNILGVVLSVLDEHQLYNVLFPYFVEVTNKFVKYKNPPMKEILKVYDIIISKIRPILISQNNQEYVSELYELTKDHGDIELQAVAIEIQLKLYCIDIEIDKNMQELFKRLDVKKAGSIDNTYPFIRIALDSLNSDSDIIFSQICNKITINSERIVEFEDSDEEDGIYLDVDLKLHKISFFCEKNTLKSLFNVNFATYSWEVISFYTKNVQSVSCQNIPGFGIRILLQIKRNNLIILSNTQDESILDLEIFCEMNSEKFIEFTNVLPQIFPSFTIQSPHSDQVQLIVNEDLSSPIISMAKSLKPNEPKKAIKISKKSKDYEEMDERFARLKSGAKSRASSRSSLSFSESIIGKARKDILSKVSGKIKEQNLSQTTSSQEIKIKKGSYSELLVKARSESSIVENWLKVCPDPNLEENIEVRSYENLHEDYSSENKIVSKEIDKDMNDTLENCSSEDICEKSSPAQDVVFQRESMELHTLPAEKEQNRDAFDQISHVSNSSSDSEDEVRCRYITRSRTQTNQRRTGKRLTARRKLPIPRVSLSTISERTEKTTARKTCEFDEMLTSLPEKDTTFVKNKSSSNNSNSTVSELDHVIQNKSDINSNNEDNSKIEKNDLIVDNTVEITEETIRNDATRLTEISMEVEEQTEDKAPPCLYPTVMVLNQEDLDENINNISLRLKPTEVGPKRLKRTFSQTSFDKIESAAKPQKLKVPQAKIDKIQSERVDNASIPSTIDESETKADEKSTTIHTTSIMNKTNTKRKLFDNSTFVSDLTRSPEPRIEKPIPQPGKKQKRASTSATRKNTSKKSSPKPRKRRTVKRLNSSFSYKHRKQSKITFDNIFDSMLEEHKEYLQERAEYHKKKGIEKSLLSPDVFEEFEKCLEDESESTPFEKPKKIQILSNIVLKKGKQLQDSCEDCSKFASILNSLLELFHATHSK